MSTGEFINSRYQASYNTEQIHGIKVQQETLEASFQVNPAPAAPSANVPPSGAVNNDISAEVSLSRRRYGLRPRFVTVRLEAPPVGGYTGRTFNIPILSPLLYSSIQRNMPCTYLGTAGIVLAKEPERAR